MITYNPATSYIVLLAGKVSVHEGGYTWWVEAFAQKHVGRFG